MNIFKHKLLLLVGASLSFLCATLISPSEDIKALRSDIDELEQSTISKNAVFLIVGKIIDRDDEKLFIWGRAAPRSAMPPSTMGILIEESNIIVYQPHLDGIIYNVYRGEHYYREKTYGENSFGVKVPNYVYGPQTSEMQEELLELEKKLQATKEKYHNERLDYVSGQLETMESSHLSAEDFLGIVDQNNKAATNIIGKQLMYTLIYDGAFSTIYEKPALPLPLANFLTKYIDKDISTIYKAIKSPPSVLAENICYDDAMEIQEALKRNGHTSHIVEPQEDSRIMTENHKISGVFSVISPVFNEYFLRPVYQEGSNYSFQSDGFKGTPECFENFPEICLIKLKDNLSNNVLVSIKKKNEFILLAQITLEKASEIKINGDSIGYYSSVGLSKTYQIFQDPVTERK